MKKTVKKIHKPNLKHGMSKTSVYKRWEAMKSRCDNPKNKYYKNYGGRGISYAPSWNKFENFWKDMKSGYSPELELERINNNKNYCKENCAWVTRREQQRNKRSNRLVTINGVEKTLIEWAEHYGWKKPNTISTRILKGWNPIKAITTPPRFTRRPNGTWENKK